VTVRTGLFQNSYGRGHSAICTMMSVP